MTAKHDLERRVADYYANEAPQRAPDRVLVHALTTIESTPQRRVLVRVPWRSLNVNTNLKLAAAVLAIVALTTIAVVRLLPSGVGTEPTPSPSPISTASPAALHEGPLSPGRYVTTPFKQLGSDACFVPPQAGCIDSTNDDAISISFTIPAGWSGSSDAGVSLTDVAGDAPEAAGLLFLRGASLFNDPCQNAGTPEIPVGPGVDDFVDAVVAHPLLQVTTPTVVTLAGHAGKYLELQVPADLAACPIYRPWEPWYYAQSAGELWHLWVLDIDGVRVVVQGMDHAATSKQRRDELQAIVNSIHFEP